MPYHPSITLCSARKWIKFSGYSNEQPKSSFLSNLILETLKKECLYTFLQTRTLQLWRSLSLRAHKIIRLNWKRNRKKLLVVPQEKKRRLTSSFTNWHLWHILLSCSKTCPWLVKTLYYMNSFTKLTNWFFLLSSGMRNKPTKTTSVCSKHLHCFCMLTTS